MKPHLIASREQLLQAIRDRRDELNVSHETLDGISGLPSGYTSKLLADPPVRGFGEMSLKAVLDALGLRIAVAVIVEDPELANRVRARWRPRQRRPVPKRKVRTAPKQDASWCVASNPQIMTDGRDHQSNEAADGKHENDRITDRA